MKKFLKLLVVAVLSITTVFGLTACGDSNTLYVYTEAGFAPFEYMNGTEIVGVDVEIAKAIAKELDMKLEVRNTNFDLITEAVKKSPKNTIGIAGMTIREIDGITFSDPYFTSQQYILAKRGTFANTNGESAIDILDGKKIGVQLSTTGHTLVNDMKEDGTLGKNSEVVTNAKYDFLAQRLEAGTIDAMVMDEQPAKSFLNKYDDLEIIKITGVEVESYGIAVASSATDLLKAINKALAGISPEQIQQWVDYHNEASSNA